MNSSARLLLIPVVLCALASAGCTSQGPAAQPEARTTALAADGAATGHPLRISSFNIQFLGSSKDRDNHALAEILSGYDIAVIQELVAPPFPGTFPDGEPFKPDPESAAFFNEMAAKGFSFVLSEEDTGTGNTIHLNSSATEWWVAFYKPQAVAPAADLPSGFLADDRSNNDDYERVPYAFAFRSPDSQLDFVLISVHLKPDASAASRNRRKHELAAINAWIEGQSGNEHDFIILGDMNMEDCDEVADAEPQGYVSLNRTCLPTNTNVNGPKPYDHVLYQPSFTGREIGTAFQVVNLVEAMRPFWTSSAPFPGDPYKHDEFRKHYSDHDPVAFELTPLPTGDDDGPSE